ncbi:antibiotic biosynthesis monooxygenase [Thalassococcus sp. S3]|uniref:antibiotic biosynthesis monooxygenase family protein n=1 Tax=Thalassococcus sp. S3 TaxID=2017482 RepID=UPI001023F48E|nr:antibiotic biosynthesis monooxygenase [Thalassococcus sp. S3]QBF33126.1 antibiotic biosynthesis monooxygenase [Thalassococcus sp. S3]
MIAVIFEVEPADGRKDDYLDIAAEMRPMVEEVEGFISVERFQSLTNPEKLLSLSFFEDEDAVMRWRKLAAHRRAQSKGRAGLFAGYRLRVAGVIRDYGLTDRKEAPGDSLAEHDR